MKHTFKNENGHLDAEVSFDKEEIAKASDKAVNKLVANVVVPGFRKGKAPKEMAVKYLHNDDVANETVNALLKQLDKNFEKDEEFSSYVKESKFARNLRPEVSLKKFSSDEAEFLVTYFLAPAITKLGEYKGLTSNAKEKKVTAKDVDAEIKKLAQDNAELVPSEKDAEMGDTVNIDFTGLMDGKPFDGGSANSFDLELGSKHFVPGFEEQCVSHKAGDKFDVALTMPENYPAPLTGKAVVFKVTLNTVKTKEVPEINDEFATTLSGQYVSKDLAELKSKVKANLTKNAFDSYRNETVNDLLLQVRDASEFAISAEYVNAILVQRKAQDENQLAQQGLSLEEYLKLVNQTMEQYENTLKTGLENEIKSSLVYEELAKAEKIAAPTKEDLEKQIGSPMDEFVKNFANYFKAQKMSDEEINNRINGYVNQVFSSIMTANVQAKLLELNVPELAKKEVKEEKAEEKPAAEAKAE
jgi:trigger factor